MLKKQIRQGETVIEYFQHGDNPTLLIQAGLHGDEFSVIPIVEKMVEKYLPRLPEFIFVPRVSPSALALKQRSNSDGVDLNRAFLENSSNPEVLANEAIAQPFHFKLLASFHEDVEFDGFYIYDSYYPMSEKYINDFCTYLKGQEIKLYTGIDDANDPIHNLQVTNGLAHWNIHWDEPLNGTFDDWAIKNKIVERLFMPEIPTVMSKEEKTLIIESVFEELILPEYS